MSVADRITELDKVGCRDTAMEDVATAETTLPLPAAEVREFLADVSRLVRLNPLLAIERWEPAERGFRFAGRNESIGQPFDLDVRVANTANGLDLHYDNGLKQRSLIRVEPADAETRLIVAEHYPRIEDPRDPRVAGVDRSLVPWVAAIRRHLLARRRWAWLPGWLWWNEGFLLSMMPRSRRIVRLLIWTTAIEFVFFLGLVVVLRLTT